MTDRWVILDVGETLIDETRVWSAWADALGIPRLTFMAGLGAVIARGGNHPEVFAFFGSTDWQERRPQLEAAYGGFTGDDLYPDAHPAFDRLRELGYRIAILANQPAKRTAELRALGFDPEVMAMSEEMAAVKPAPAFFARSLELLGSPPRMRILCVVHSHFSRSMRWIGGALTVAIAQRNAGSGDVHDSAPRLVISPRM